MGLALASAIGSTASGSAWGQKPDVEREIQSHAAVGARVRLGGHVNYDRACRIVIPTKITVIQVPQHGNVTVRDEVVKSAHPELGTGDKCKGQSGKGKVVYYTRTTTGSDRLIYDSSSDNGVVQVTVTVD